MTRASVKNSGKNSGEMAADDGGLTRASVEDVITDARAKHGERPENALERQRYLCRLMAGFDYERGKTDKELALAWEATAAHVRQWTAEASRHLKLSGEREVVLSRVRAVADARLDAAEDRDVPPLARLLVDTVGGFDQKVSVNMQVSAKPDAEIIAGTIRELVASDDTREQVRKALAEWDSGATGGVAMITEGSEVEGP